MYFLPFGVIKNNNKLIEIRGAVSHRW